MLYLDNNATTPLDPQVRQAMGPYWEEHYGNPASVHHNMGYKAEKAVEASKEQIAAFLGCEKEEIVFTSGSTESINLAMKGMAEFAMAQGIGNHLITVSTEHKAVLETAKHLSERGVEVTVLPVNGLGHIDLEELESAIRPTTFMLCVMHANNETGVVHPIEKVAQIAKQHNIVLFCDATQSVGKIRLDLCQVPIDLLCFSGHKIYAPKGVGALVVRKNKEHCRPTAQIHGGSQQHGMRSSTSNVPGIVGIGASCHIFQSRMDEETTRLKLMRDEFERRILILDSTFVNGDTTHRLPGVTNICFSDVDAENMSLILDDMSFSNGSACTSRSPELSHVLKSMGLSKSEVASSVRFSLGRFNTFEQIQEAGDRILSCVQNRAMHLCTLINAHNPSTNE